MSSAKASRNPPEVGLQQVDRFPGGLQGFAEPAGLLHPLMEHYDARGKVGPEGVGPCAREVAEDLDGLLDGLERVLAPSQVPEAVGEIVEAPGEVGPEGVGPCAREYLDGLLAGFQRVLAPSQVPEAVGEVVEVLRSGRKASGQPRGPVRSRRPAGRRPAPPRAVPDREAPARLPSSGEVGPEGLGPCAREVPGDLDGLLDGFERLLAPSQVRESAGEVVEAPGEVGPEGVGPYAREAAVDLDGLLVGLERLLAPSQVREADGAVVGPRRELLVLLLGPLCGPPSSSWVRRISSTSTAASRRAVVESGR